jgi:hypothetical protein
MKYIVIPALKALRWLIVLLMCPIVWLVVFGWTVNWRTSNREVREVFYDYDWEEDEPFIRTVQFFVVLFVYVILPIGVWCYIHGINPL